MSLELGGIVYWIRQVFVSQEARRRGVYKALHQTITKLADADPSVKCVRLLVDAGNTNAQNVYKRLGMSQLDTHNFDEIDYVF